MASTRLVLTCALASALASCGGGGGFPDAKVIDATPPGGRFSLAWTVTDAAGNPTTCDQIGGSSVAIAYHDPHVAGGGAEAFTCGTGMGTSQVIPFGTYDMTITLVDNTGNVLVTLPTLSGIVVAPSQTTVVPAATFAVVATGNLKLHMASRQTAGNCAAKAAGGAGITSTTITLTNGSDGSCAPITFAVGSGSNQPASSYTVGCGSATVGPCFEADQELDALGIPSGSYQIHVDGFSGGTDCWTNDDTLRVPSTGRDLTETLNLGASGGSGC